MKYFNRRDVLFRKNDNLEIEGRYFKIVAVKEMPPGLLELGTIALAAGATPEAPAWTAPTEGAKVEMEHLVPKETNILVHIFVGVQADGLEVQSVLPGPLTRIIERSCMIRAFQEKETPFWISPDREELHFITKDESPIDDPNEQYQLWLVHGDKFYLRADNPHSVAIAQYLRLSGAEYTLEPLTEAPEKFTPINTARCPKLFG